MTKQEIDEIEARANAATEGPFVLLRHDSGHDTFYDVLTHESLLAITQMSHMHDAKFIAHAHQDVQELIAEVKRVQAGNKRLREALIGLKLSPAIVDGIEQGN